MIRDAGGTVWRCIGYSDGTVGERSMSAAADDGEGALAGAAPTSRTERVTFDKGTSGIEIAGSLTPGSSGRHVLCAKNGQDFSVRLADDTDTLSYQILNPDGTFLLDQMNAALEYRGQLWQTGDHVIEVINRGNRTAFYTVIIGID